MARPAAFRCVSLLLLILGSAGCFGPRRDWTDDFVWSPDGRHAVILGRDLNLTDTSGSLTPLHIPDVYRVAWLSDSERLLVARSREVRTFAEIVSAVGGERAASIVARAEQAWFAESSYPDPQAPSHGIARDAHAMVLYLRERHADEVQKLSEEDRRATLEATASVHTLAVVRIAGDRAVIGRVIFNDLTPIRTIRPAPNDRTVAFVTENEEFLEDGTVTTWVVPTDGSTPASQVEQDTGQFPDWTPDGRSLVYHSVWGTNPNVGAIGVIKAQPILDRDGLYAPSQTSSDLVDLIYEYGDSLRVASDGRVLFNGFFRHFPHASAGTRDMITFTNPPTLQRLSIAGQRLFAFDPSRAEDPPVLLTEERDFDADALAFFELSPDRTRVVYGTVKGVIRVLCLSDGRAERLPVGLDRGEPYAGYEVPRVAWAGPDAFVYARPNGERLEFVLRRGSDDTVLSRTWPADLLGARQP